MLAAFFGVIALNLFAAPQTQAPPSSLPDVVVSGTRHTPREARRFVDEISTAPIHALTLSTWLTPICLGVINLKAEAAAAIVARIEAEAAEVGVPVAPAGCRPYNITLLATSDGRFTASELVDAYRDRFIVSSGATQGDGEALRRFVETEAPVRWWTISALMDEDSKRTLVSLGGGPAPIEDTTGEVYFGQNRREGMLASLVILDLSKMNDVPDIALGDYIAMVVLADIDPEARPRSPTILNLWREGEAVAGLTPWDRAYLRALYQAPVRLSGSGLQTRSLYQLNEMARLMSVQLGQAAEPAP